jgi:predicted dehydrogenase
MITQPVRIAMVGCGRMGWHHSERLKEDGRGVVTALLDRVPSAAAGLQKAFWPASKIFQSLDQLSGCIDVDAAILSTPTVEHFQQAMRCLDNGWHVLCEKPLASDADQIRMLITRSGLAAELGQRFSLGYQRRHLAIYKTMRREILSGRWGRVRAVVSHNMENWQSTIGGTWRDDPCQNSGGFITDAGSHKLDCIFYVTELRPIEVFARCQNWGSQVEINASISALLTDDVTATIEFIGNAQYFAEDLHVHCEDADLMLRHGELWLVREGHRELLPADEPESSPVQGLLDSILHGAAEISPPSAALPVYELTQGILKSHRLGQSVRIN